MDKRITTTKIRLRKCESQDAWMLYLEAYPVYQSGKLKRVRQNLGRKVTSVVWVTDLHGNRHEQRDKNGIIKCTLQNDIEACKFAEEVRKKAQRDYDLEFLRSDEDKAITKLREAADGDFIDYMKFELIRRHRNSSDSIRVNWKRAIELLKIFTKGKELFIKDIDVNTLENIKQFLRSAPMGGGKTGKLSQNSASTYFSIIRAALHQAFVDGYLPVDISAKIKNIPEEESKREYLTLSELQQLADTPCEISVLKDAALFSALTGLRHSDIMKLTWTEVIDDEQCGSSRLSLKQQKTKHLIEMPISSQARKLCGERRDDSQRVFEDLTPPAWISRPLKKWIAAAGIKKHITFHCFRHTYATLQLASGTDIFTVSKMLGHTNVRTTMVYTKLVDAKKQQAANAIHIDGLEQ